MINAWTILISILLGLQTGFTIIILNRKFKQLDEIEERLLQIHSEACSILREVNSAKEYTKDTRRAAAQIYYELGLHMKDRRE